MFAIDLDAKIVAMSKDGHFGFYSLFVTTANNKEGNEEDIEKEDDASKVTENGRKVTVSTVNDDFDNGASSPVFNLPKRRRMVTMWTLSKSTMEAKLWMTEEKTQRYLTE